MPRKLQIQEQGWTLAELLIVLAILGILSMLAGPSYHAVVARAQARSVTAEIASELRLARQLAMARRERHGSYSIERAVPSRFAAPMPRTSCTSTNMQTREWWSTSQQRVLNFCFILVVGRRALQPFACETVRAEKTHLP